MKLTDLTIEIRDQYLTRIGQIPVEEIDDMLLRDKFNQVGDWTISIRPHHPAVPLLKAKGSGIVVSLYGETLFSGPMVSWTHTATPGRMEAPYAFKGVSDDIVLADRLCYPNWQSNDMTLQYPIKQTASVERLMRQLVRRNCGTASTDARDAGVWISGDPEDHDRGPTRTKTIDFQNLGAMLRELAWPGHLGFRLIQREDEHLRFETYVVEDRTDTVQLDFLNNTLDDVSVTQAAPTATRMVVVGDKRTDKPKYRTYRAVSTSDSVDAEGDWGRRIERLAENTDSDATTDDLDETGEDVLVKEGLTFTEVKGSPSDSSDHMIFHRHWALGDKVAIVEPLTDEMYSQTVTGYALKFTPSELRFSAMVGEISKPTPATRASSSGRAGDRNGSSVTGTDVDGDTVPEGDDGSDSGFDGTLAGDLTVGGQIWLTDDLNIDNGDIDITHGSITINDGDLWVNDDCTVHDSLTVHGVSSFSGLMSTGQIYSNNMRTQRAAHASSVATSTGSWEYSAISGDTTRDLSLIWPPSGVVEVSIAADAGSASVGFLSALGVRVKDNAGTQILAPTTTAMRHARRTSATSDSTGQTISRTCTIANADFATAPTTGDTVKFELGYITINPGTNVFFVNRSLVVKPSL